MCNGEPFHKTVGGRAMPHKSVEPAAKELAKEVVLVHGAPKEIPPNQDREYANELGRSYTISGSRCSTTLSCMARSSGLAERINREFANRNSSSRFLE